MKKFLVILLLIFITSGIAVAYAPSLKIRDTDLDCDEDLFDGGYDSCTLSIDLRIDDYSYSSQYDNYTYKVECEATFNYLDAKTSWSKQNYESDYIRIYGTNRTKTLEIETDFSSFEKVYKVNVSNLSCRVKDVY